MREVLSGHHVTFLLKLHYNKLIQMKKKNILIKYEKIKYPSYFVYRLKNTILF